MNYRHAYHAGGFADVLKHLVLVALLRHLTNKSKPFCYIETHAGAGSYRLNAHTLADGTAEFEQGIQRLIQAIELYQPPLLIREYIDIVKGCGYPDTYPGSPLIASQILGGLQRLFLSELHPETHQLLTQALCDDATAQCLQQEGYGLLKALLPPRERRALILIDPPFESPNEWAYIVQALEHSLQRFSTGIYLVWFPMKDLRTVRTWLSKVSALESDKGLLSSGKNFVIEWSPYDQKTTYWGLAACGLLIINLPWHVQTGLMEDLDYLNRALGGHPKAQISLRALCELRRTGCVSPHRRAGPP